MRKKIETVRLDYGRVGLEIEIDREAADWNIIEPAKNRAPDSFSDSFAASVTKPVGTAPLREIIEPSDEVIIVTADGTRPVPNRLLIPALIRHCNLKPENVTILIGTGSHRPHSKEELVDLIGPDIMTGCRVICHDASDIDSLGFLGNSPGGIPVYMNKDYIHAAKKIVLGFIEPHFFAGYSGGAKGICPAVCGLETIDAFHSFDIIGHPASDYGRLDDNPQQAAAREVVSMASPDFMINVVLNSDKEVTHIFSGHVIEAHRAGCRKAAETAMVSVPRKYPLVITSNSGYPLDQNLYQTVKGITAAAHITEPGGTIIIASECSRGIPDDGNFARIMASEPDPITLLDKLSTPDFKLMDRWQAQKLAKALKNFTVKIYSSLDSGRIEPCKMIKIDDIQDAVRKTISKIKPRPHVAVMPHGPLTIPYLSK